MENDVNIRLFMPVKAPFIRLFPYSQSIHNLFEKSTLNIFTFSLMLQTANGDNINSIFSPISKTCGGDNHKECRRIHFV